jgi:hypothetical protein
MTFDYFYGHEDAEQFLFYRILKTLITGEGFREVSVEAKLLYGLMLDRLSLSMKNGWFDDLNRAYIVYTVEDIMSDLQCGNQKGTNCIAQYRTVIYNTTHRSSVKVPQIGNFIRIGGCR